jgi:uncharacterized protein
MNLRAHFWTIAPSLRHGVVPLAAPSAERWTTTLPDTRYGAVSLSGLLRVREGSNACLIVVHGLGGAPDAFYCVHAARAAERQGMSCLRLALRGADRSGEDFYHAGLTSDIEAAVASAALARFSAIYVLGYSLGGHVTLRYMQAAPDPRVRAACAICAPLDLELSAQAIDQPRAALYRHAVLNGLKGIYRAVAKRRAVPTPLGRVLLARSIREWDALTVVPRFGFGSVDEYYARMSAGPRLGELTRPTLLLQVADDPMVPPWAYRRHLEHALPQLEVHSLEHGGHVGFPARVRFGESEQRVEEHALAWLMQHS